MRTARCDLQVGLEDRVAGVKRPCPRHPPATARAAATSCLILRNPFDAHVTRRIRELVELEDWLLVPEREGYNVLLHALHRKRPDFVRLLRSGEWPCPWYPGPGWNPGACTEAAALNRDLELLRFMRAGPDPCPWDCRLIMWAARNGDLDIIEFARSCTLPDGTPDPCPWDPRACAYAIDGGRPDIVHWLREQDPPCPWNYAACSEAVRKSDLPLLRWLREQGCDWQAGDCLYLADFWGCDDCAEYILQEMEREDSEGGEEPEMPAF